MCMRIAIYFPTNIIFLCNTSEIHLSCQLSIDCYNLFRLLNHNSEIKVPAWIKHIASAASRTCKQPTIKMLINPLSFGRQLVCISYLLISAFCSPTFSFTLGQIRICFHLFLVFHWLNVFLLLISYGDRGSSRCIMITVSVSHEDCVGATPPKTVRPY